MRSSGVVLVAVLACVASAQAPATQESLFNVARVDVQATVGSNRGSFVKNTPPAGAITLSGPDAGRGSTFNAPLTGRVFDVRLPAPVPIKAIEVTPLRKAGLTLPKSADLFIDNKPVGRLQFTPAGDPVRTAVNVKGSIVRLVVTEVHGNDGQGGWERVAVFSPVDLMALMRKSKGYEPPAANAQFIAPTAGTMPAPTPEVHGQPRQAQGHPRTLWDKEDIAHYRGMLKTSELLRQQYESLKKAMDERMTREPGIPQPRKNEKGEWAHLSDAENNTGKIHNQLSLDIANLATVYVLSGEDKYGDFAKKLLLAYADAYPNYGVGARAGFSHDPSKVFDQRLSDATWLIQLSRSYDLIHDLPSITPAERKHIEDDLLRANARFIAAAPPMLKSQTNWAAITTASILITGYATDDQELIDLAMHGPDGKKDPPTGGVMLHFSDKCIDADGMWVEGSSGYQFMALEALITDAEILWRNGVDLYRHRNGIVKRLFDSLILYAYPNLFAPAVHDNSGSSLVSHEANLWEYAYLRYRDPRYLRVITQAPMNLEAQFQKFPVSVLYDRDPAAAPPPHRPDHVNFFGVGFGISRLADEQGRISSLLLDYGPARSHGHPDKLNVDLFALGDRLIPDPGAVWYELPLYRGWYRTTVAHNTLVINEEDQVAAGANQVVYGPAQTLAIQRAWTDKAYLGVAMDRSLFHTPQYVADLFGAFTGSPRTMDLAWHFNGKFSSDLPLQAWNFPQPAPNGYRALGNVRRAETADAWSAAIAAKGGTARFVAAGGAATQIIVGDGHLKNERIPTILQRRPNTDTTIFANAVDISGGETPFVRGVSVSGGLEQGWALLNVKTAQGEDLCYVGFRAGEQQAGPLRTDARQAMVLMDGATLRALYLGGGMRLSVGEASIERDRPGLAYLEKTAEGWRIGNTSPEAATIRVTFAPLAGKRGGDASANSAGEITLKLEGMGAVVMK